MIKSKHLSPSSSRVQGFKCYLSQILGINSIFVIKKTINISIYSQLGCSILISKITQLTALSEIYHLFLTFTHLFEHINSSHIEENV